VKRYASSSKARPPRSFPPPFTNSTARYIEEFYKMNHLGTPPYDCSKQTKEQK
jgi:hypothetical protein